MKTAEQWMEEGMNGKYKDVPFVKRVRMVQADALWHAAMICDGDIAHFASDQLRDEAEQLEKQP